MPKQQKPPAQPHVHGPDCDHEHAAEAAPFRREMPKLGRNEPCFCGSGRKFKKCHGALDPNQGN